MFIREFNAKVFSLTVFLNDLPLGSPVLTRQRFVEAVFHDIAELMQFGTVVGNCIIIAEPSYFPIVLIEDAEVCSASQFPTMCGLPNLCPIVHYDLHGAKLQQFLLYNGSGYFQHNVSAVVSGLSTFLGFLGMIALWCDPDVEVEKFRFVRRFGHQCFLVRQFQFQLFRDIFADFLFN